METKMVSSVHHCGGGGGDDDEYDQMIATTFTLLITSDLAHITRLNFVLSSALNLVSYRIIRSIS